MNRNQRISLIGFLLFCLANFQTYAQQDHHPIASKIQQLSAEFKNLKSPVLLELASNQASKKADLSEEVNEATFLSFQQNSVNELLKNPTELLEMSLPVNKENPLHLTLYRAQVFAPGFQVYVASNPDEPFNYTPGSYYWGIVNGDEHSLAAIAIAQDEVMGFVYVNGETYTLGKLNQSLDDTHILYKEHDLKITPTHSCGTVGKEYYIGNETDGLTANAEKSSNNCVNMYVEVDYDIYVGKGGVTQAADYVSGVFSQVAILYANEAINFTVSEIVVWDVVDPYTGSSTSDYLNQFRTSLNGNYNGDLAHLVGYNGGGGIAYVDVLCNSTYGIGYSDINSTYANVPTYSWTIEVVTHEIGHNLGSRHTHDCVWNGDNTAIDGCGPAAGYGNNCGGGPIPNKGTIMSYCHLVGGVGIDFNLGFGTQPGDLIRNEVYNAPCLSACATQTTDDAGISNIIAPVGPVCSNTTSPQVELLNYGTNSLTSVTIEYELDGNPTGSVSWTGNLSSNSAITVTLPSITFGNGSHTFSATTSNPNGSSDGNTANDSSNSNFNRPADQTYYADNDGDGFGDPTKTIVDCTQPPGYVLNNTDCDDTDANAYPGASCSDGNVCTVNDVLDSNCNCSGTYSDSDGDGVCDGLDICPGGDDNVDTDNDGIPDYCDCNPATTSFTINPLTHSGSGSSSSSTSFATDSKDPSFVISNLNAKTNGNPNGRYIDKVTVTYIDGNGNNQTYGTFNGNLVSSANVGIVGEVLSVTVSLEDGYDGNYNGTLSVNLSDIDYCNGCSDSDGDGVCDADDVCPNFDDNLIGTSCNDGDDCTTGDVYNNTCSCVGTPTGDSDGDGVCDALDVCPGGDDNIDTDGDGIPDDCDNSNCTNEITSSFNPDPLTHQGTGSSISNVSFPSGNEDVYFTIDDLGAKQNGNPNKRYIDEVTISYVDGNNNTVIYGTFSGDNQNSVSVSISGAVQSVEVSLTDGYDGDTGNEQISVDLSDVISCLQTGAIVIGGPQDIDNTNSVNVYPNPAKQELYLRFGHAPEFAEIELMNVFGQQISSYEVQGQSIFRMDLNKLQLESQTILVSIRIKGQQPITERVLFIK